MKEYRIVDVEYGSWWPEVYGDDQQHHLKGDLDYLHSTHKHGVFFVEEREVGEWHRFEPQVTERAS